MPDGRVARFEVPDGTTPEQAQSMMEAHFSAPTPAPNPAPVKRGLSESETPGVGQTLLIGAGRTFDKVLDGMTQMYLGARGEESALKGLKKSYDDKAELYRPLQEARPFATGIGEALPSLAVPVGGGVGVASTVGRLALAGGVPAALEYGSVEDRAKGFATGAGAAVAGGAAGALLGKAAGWGANKLSDRMIAKGAVQQSANAVRDATLAASRDAGYVVTPSQAGSGGLINSVLEGVGGKIKTQQAASVRNQSVTDSLVRKTLGMADDAPITKEALSVVRNQAGQQYEAMRQLGTIQADPEFKAALSALASKTRSANNSFPGLTKENPIDEIVKALDQPAFNASDAVDAISVLRDKADSLYASGDKAAGKSIKEISTALEDALERSASASGNAGLAKSFRDARKLIAKTYSVQSALNEGAGTVSAQKLGQQLARNKPLSGELRSAAEFAQTFPKAAQSGVDVPAYSVLDAAAGSFAIGSGNPLLAALPAVRPLARSSVLNPTYQRLMVNPPSYGPGRLTNAITNALQGGATQNLLRVGGTAAGIAVGNELARR
jgi:hypothetical protein